MRNYLKSLSAAFSLVFCSVFLFASESWAANSDSLKADGDKPKKNSASEGMKFDDSDAFSLMFNDDEIENISAAVKAYRGNQKFVFKGAGGQKIEENAPAKVSTVSKLAAPEDVGYLYLQSIIYLGSHNWSLWINGKKMTAENNDPNKSLYIKSINKNSATFVWKIDQNKWKELSGKISTDNAKVNSNNQVEIETVLSLNQAYSVKTDKVIDGLEKVEEYEEAKSAPTANKSAPSEDSFDDNSLFGKNEEVKGEQPSAKPLPQALPPKTELPKQQPQPKTGSGAPLNLMQQQSIDVQ